MGKIHPEIVPPPTTVVEQSKRLAAWTAVDRHVLPEYKVCRSALTILLLR